MENELRAEYEIAVDDYTAIPLPKARMHFTSAFFFGAWYSIILAAAMSAGVKYLHPDTHRVWTITIIRLGARVRNGYSSLKPAID